MLSSIHPLGERARGHRWGVTVAWYITGALLGGALVGASAGLLGWAAHRLGEPSQSWLTIAVVGLAVAAACFDAFHLPFPSPERQVNESWLTRYRAWVYGGGFGFQMGTGVMTFVTTASIHLLWILAALTGSVALGALVGAWFGLVRGTALLSVRRVHDPASLRAYFTKMARLAPAAHGLAVVTPLAAASLVIALEVAS